MKSARIPGIPTGEYVKNRRSRNAARTEIILTQGTPDHSRALQAPQEALVDTFFKDKDPKTVKAYRRLLEDFRLWMKADSIDEAARLFFSKGHGNANLLAMNWKAALIEQKYAPASINAHLVALRSFVKVARIIGIIPWSLEVANVRHESYRDTAGPGAELFHKVWSELRDRSDPISVRDRAVISLIHDAGMRRDEICSLDLEHVDWTNHRVWAQAKKKGDRVGIPINQAVEAELKTWLQVRGREPGALFKNFDPKKKSDRLSGRTVGRITNRYGLGHAHGLRHLAITTALQLTNGNIGEVMKFSRHADPKTVMIYDDNRKNVSGAISEKLSRSRMGLPQEKEPPAEPKG